MITIHLLWITVFRRCNMSDITQRALAASLMQLLEQTPLDKIRIKDIVKGCGLNRNTFYYHFQDVYSLLDWIFQKEYERLALLHETTSWEDTFIAASEYLLEHKKTIYHIYNSINRENLDNYLYQIMNDIMMDYVKEQAQGFKINPELLQSIAMFYKYAIVGLILDWIRTGMKEEPVAILNNLTQICNGHVQMVINNSLSN